MKQRFVVCLFAVFLFACLAWASGLTRQTVSLVTSATVTATADPLALITTGKTYLEQHNILAARDAFQAAVTADASNQEAQLLYGVTRVLAVYEDGQSTQTAALDSVKEIGELSGLVFSHFGLYDTNAIRPDLLPVTTPTSGEAIAFLTTKLLPQVEGAIANLNAVSSPAFSSSLQPAALVNAANIAVTVDYADTQVIKALLYAIQSKLELLRVYGLNANLPNLLNDEIPNLKRVRDLLQADATLLAPLNPSRLTNAKAAFVSFVDTFNSAVTAVKGRSVQTGHLFVLDQPLDDAPFNAFTNSVDKVLAALAEVRASLDGPQRYTFIEDSSRAVVDLSKFFNATSPVNFRSMLANCTTSTALPDSTLGGIFPLGLSVLQQDAYSYRQHILGAACSTSVGMPMMHAEGVLNFFHAPAYGYVTPPLYVTISNRGSADLSLSSISVKGADAASFRLFPETCPNLTPTLSPGSSCRISVEFAANAGEAKQATLELLSNDPTHSVKTLPVYGQTDPTSAVGGISPGQVTAMAFSTAVGYVAVYNQGIYRTTAPGGGSWLLINEGLTNLQVTSLVTDPVTGQIYVGTYGGGVFKSGVDGKWWGAVSNGLQSSYVSSLAAGPSVLYAGTYTGLFKSTDGGASWMPLRAGLPASPITSIAIDPGDSNKVYCVVGGQQEQLYASLDGGVTWQLRSLPAPFNYLSAAKVVVGEGSPGTVMLAGDYGVLKSADAGVSWQSVHSQPVKDIVAVGSSPTYYYLLSDNQLYQSTDSGQTWQQNPVTASVLAASQSSPTTLYLAEGTSVYSTFNTGVTLNNISWPQSDGVIAVRNFTVDPVDSSIILAAALDKGVLKSIDGGATWDPANAQLEGKTVLTVRASSMQSGSVLAGTLSGGLFMSSSNGSTGWQQLSGGIPTTITINDLLAIPGTPEQFIAATSNGLYRSADGGGTWATFSDLSGDIRAVAYGNGYLYAASPTVLYRGLLGSGSLAPVGTIPLNQYGVQPIITSLLVLPGEQSTVYVVQSDGALIKSTNGGELAGITPRNSYGWLESVLSLNTHPQNPTLLIAGSNNGIYYTNDAGTTWSSLNAGLGYARSLVVAAGGSSLVVGSYDRIYRLAYPATSVPSYQLNLTVNGSGAAFSAAAQFSCGGNSSCSKSLAEGTLVELTPYPWSSSVFSSWSGCDSVVGDACQVRMTAAKNVTATFVADTRPLVLMAFPPGGSYQAAQNVTLVSNKNVPIYYTLNGSDPSQTSSYYVGPVAVAASATLKYRALDNGTLSAVTSQVYTITPPTALLRVERTGTATVGGSITPSTGSLNWSGSVGSASYALNTSLSLTACKDADTSFGGWSGCDSTTPVGDCLACNITLASDKTVGATFNLLDYVRLVGGGSYGTLKTAHDAAGAAGGILWGRAVTLSEGDLRIDWPLDLRGGYDLGFSTQTDFTTLQGTLTIGGSLVVDRLIIK